MTKLDLLILTQNMLWVIPLDNTRFAKFVHNLAKSLQPVASESDLVRRMHHDYMSYL